LKVRGLVPPARKKANANLLLLNMLVRLVNKKRLGRLYRRSGVSKPRKRNDNVG
jgi:hypothetical protein